MSQSTVKNVSDTALWVAAYRAIESERKDALYHDPLADRLAGKRGHEIARAMPYGRITAWIMAVRTVAIDRLIQQALADGVDTVVNLGAGLDTRPYRMELPKALRWIEVDFPHLIEMKSQNLVAETPRCELRRIGLDLSERPAASQLYAELGQQTRNALILTEGVVPYLTNEQAGHLALDLRKVRSFRFWIQDYRASGEAWRPPAKLKKKLANAPFQFEHSDPLAFFAEFGWSMKANILAMDEGQRLHRRFPMPFPWNLLTPFISKEKMEPFRRANGYVMFQADGKN